MTYEILLVEDNPDDADLVTDLLEQCGTKKFLVTVAERLSCASEYLRERKFDIVLLDLSLPDSFGINTISSIHQEAPQIPIIVLTGSDDENLAIESLKLGSQDYLCKTGLDSIQLERSIRYSVERNRLLVALKKAEEEKNELEETVEEQQRLLGWQGSSVAATIAGIGPLRVREPKEYQSIVCEYENLINQYVGSLNFKKELPRRAMDRMACRMGQLNCGPKDVVDIHLQILKQKNTKNDPKIKPYAVEGRLFCIEIMGFLVDYYRLFHT